eukprot:Pompholyxophrys_punicea_v1_NODE_65_length_3933_cov_4.311501.p1 type:complete len:1258 gc:universal NODE_65_length_3933_cov_4.311501:125-3898(+)
MNTTADWEEQLRKLFWNGVQENSSDFKIRICVSERTKEEQVVDPHTVKVALENQNSRFNNALSREWNRLLPQIKKGVFPAFNTDFLLSELKEFTKSPMVIRFSSPKDSSSYSISPEPGDLPNCRISFWKAIFNKCLPIFRKSVAFLFPFLNVACELTCMPQLLQSEQLNKLSTVFVSISTQNQYYNNSWNFFSKCWFSVKGVLNFAVKLNGEPESKFSTLIEVLILVEQVDVFGLVFRSGCLQVDAKICENSTLTVLEFARKNGKIRIENDLGGTTILYLFECGYLKKLENQKSAVNFELMNADGNTLTHLACLVGRLEGLIFLSNLLDFHSSFHIKNKAGWKPHHLAIQQGHVALVSFIFDLGTVDINEPNPEGDPPIFAFIRTKNFQMFDRALEMGANPSFVNLNTGETCLLCASAVSGSAKIVEKLLSLNVDVNATLVTDHNALTVCLDCENPDMQVVKLLLNASIDVNNRSKNGKSPLSLALNSPNSAEIVSMLINAGVFFSDEDHLLDIVTSKKDTKTLEILIEAGCSFPVPPGYMPTPKFSYIFKDFLNYESCWTFQAILSYIVKHDLSNSGQYLLKLLDSSIHFWEGDILLWLTSDCPCNPLDIPDRPEPWLDIAEPWPGGTSWFVAISHPKTCQNDELFKAALAAASLNHDMTKLMNAKDTLGRQLFSLASSSVQRVFNQYRLFYGNYDLLSKEPIHVSATCVVMLAQYYGARVALKMMRNQRQFEREKTCRQTLTAKIGADMSSNVFVNTYEFISDPAFGVESAKIFNKYANKLPNDSAAYPYCVVMIAADRTLFDILMHELGGEETSLVKIYAQSLFTLVDSLHRCGWVHGDLKPLNIVRVGLSLRLIDFDAAVPFNTPVGSDKYSSAYLPPEMVVFSPLTLQYEVVSVNASPSTDIWAVGVILFHLLAKRSLWHEDQANNLSQDELLLLSEWTPETKKKKMDMIPPGFGASLVWKLLEKDPEKRPQIIGRLLDDPFFTGIVGRSIGNLPSFGAFISYRVASDANLALNIYDMLEKQNLNPWLDKKMLKEGEDWQDGFCLGLMQSFVYLPLLSSDALSPMTQTAQSSIQDNFLLEMLLALDLESRGFLKILPVILPDLKKDDLISTPGPAALQKRLHDILQSHNLGPSIRQNESPEQTVHAILAFQGLKISKDLSNLSAVVEKISLLKTSNLTNVPIEEAKTTNLDDVLLKAWKQLTVTLTVKQLSTTLSNHQLRTSYSDENKPRFFRTVEETCVGKSVFNESTAKP